jgi:hypothetical protein
MTEKKVVGRHQNTYHVFTYKRAKEAVRLRLHYPIFFVFVCVFILLIGEVVIVCKWLPYSGLLGLMFY